MKVVIRDPSRSAPRCGAYVVFATQAKDGARKPVPAALEEVKNVAEGALAPTGGGEGALSVAPLPAGSPAERLYVFGAGSAEILSPRKARTLFRTVLKTLEKNGETSAILDFPFGLERMDGVESREFLLRTFLLSAYRFDRYKSEGNTAPELTTVRWNLGRGPWADVSRQEAEREAREAAAVAAVSALVRDAGNTPSNDLVPRHFAAWAAREGKARGIAVRVLGKKEIVKERMGGLLAVNRGAAEEPRFVVMEYRGGRRGEAPVVLVGKGVTFDSGGISLKDPPGMDEMKFDMTGAASVIGAVCSLAVLGAPVNVVAIVAACENMPSGRATKPGDIVRSMSGQTIEVLNTDAEGRLILCDALTYSRRFKPRLVIDVATLTGACVVALGAHNSAVMSNDDGLADGLVAAGRRSADTCWRMPLAEEYSEQLKSNFADFANVGGRDGGAVTAACILWKFVDGLKWAHLDIAGTAYQTGAAKGATGRPVPLLVDFLLSA